MEICIFVELSLSLAYQNVRNEEVGFSDDTLQKVQKNNVLEGKKTIDTTCDQKHTLNRALAVRRDEGKAYR